MKYLPLFIIICIVDLIAVLFNLEILERIAKPLIIPALILFFIVNHKIFEKSLVLVFILALFFSFLGDVLLLFPTEYNFFIFGLGAFLLSHLFYIFFFFRYRYLFNVKPRFSIRAFLAIGLYLSLILFIVLPHVTSDLLIPVITYAVVISFMLLATTTLKNLISKHIFLMLIAGASLFVISDSLIALNKFVYDHADFSFYVMITYILAQFLICFSIIKHSQTLTLKE